jgi:hypothetical protein
MRLLLRRATRAMSQQPVWIMIALALDAAIAVTGILIGPSFNLTGLLAVGPLLACARCTGRVTALVAGYALALCVLVAVITGTTRTTLLGYGFGTVILAEFAPGEVRIVNCGHHPPVKLAAGTGTGAGAGGLQVMTPDGFSPPLGLHPAPGPAGHRAQAR